MLKSKFLSVVLILTMILVALSGCDSSEPTTQPDPVQEEPTTQPEAKPEPVEPPAPAEVKVYQGLGKSVNFRVGPGKDSEDVPVYSINYVTADALFDEEGKIINVYVDALELSTPNYDGESMPHFSGWPGTGGYNVTDHDTALVSGVSENTEENIAKEVNNWATKRDRGDHYGMNYANDWYKQMDFYQEFFKGKTVSEIEDWFAKSCSDLNGRPLKEDSSKEEDIAKYAKLSDEEKAVLADVVSGATMSVSDSHGDMIGAIKDAYENRVEIIIGGSDSDKEAKEAASKNEGNKSGDFVDGTYKVEFEDFDGHGYKPQLEFTISSGKITEVTYDEVTKDGAKKSEDASYKDKMLEHSTTYPEEAFLKLAQNLLDSQSTSIDAVSGATASSDTFKKLVEYALKEMAPQGTTTGKIPN